jgi:hypothetical protein
MPFDKKIREGPRPRRLGYATLSSAEQDTALPIRDLEGHCVRTHLSRPRNQGTQISRPELDKMIDRLSGGDEVVVWKLDRLRLSTPQVCPLVSLPHQWSKRPLRHCDRLGFRQRVPNGRFRTIHHTLTGHAPLGPSVRRPRPSVPSPNFVSL